MCVREAARERGSECVRERHPRPCHHHLHGPSPPPRKKSRSMYYGEHGVVGFVGDGGEGFKRGRSSPPPRKKSRSTYHGEYGGERRESEEREREKRLYEPFVLHVPIQWAI